MLFCMELNWRIWQKRNMDVVEQDLLKKVSALAGISNIPEIMMQAELIDKILHGGYLDNAGIH